MNNDEQLYHYVNAANWPTTLVEAKTFAKKAVNEFKYKEKVPGFLRSIDNAKSIQRIQSLVINAILSGEGNKVI